MDYRHIGTLTVSTIGLGCNNFGTAIDDVRSRAVVDAALEAGITYFDTADSYGKGRSEAFLSAALGSRRSEVVIATKWGSPLSLSEGERAGDPALIARRLDDSLRRLGTDYVDHYQLHRPDPETPHAETLGCLAELKAAGKIREIGCSYFTADELTDAHEQATGLGVPPYASVQNHYSLLTRDAEGNGVFDTCARLGIAFVPYFPLESGLLTGKYRRGEARPEGSRLATWGRRGDEFVDDTRLDIVEDLIAWAAARDRTLLELALSWHTSQPAISSVIAGATTPEQVAANVAASSWALTDADRAQVDAIIRRQQGDAQTPNR